MKWLVKVSRPGFWLTSIWFYLLPVGREAVWLHWTFWIGLIYVTLPLGLLIYGWNDIVDVENDRRNPRKDTFLFGARPSAEEIAILPRWIVLFQAPFILLFLILLGPKSLWWWIALTASTAIYNAPRFGFKNWPGVDMLNQVAYVLVFVLGSWINHVPQLPWFTFAFGTLFAMHSHLFGQIMDYAPDLAAGRRTTAGTVGVVPAKLIVAALLGVETLIVWEWAGDAWMASVLWAGMCFFLADAILLWKGRPYADRQMRLFFIAWNAAALLSIPWVWKTAALRCLL